MAQAQARVMKPVILDDDEETLEDIRPAGRIQPLEIAEESSEDRLLRKHIPAWVASGFVHVLLISSLLGVQFLYPPAPLPPPTEAEVKVIADDTPELEPTPLTETRAADDLKRDNSGDAAKDDKKKEDPLPVIEVETKDEPEDPSVIDPFEKTNEFTDSSKKGAVKQPKTFYSAAFDTRSAKNRSELLEKEGGSKESELAVGRGLSWLAHQQKENGSWCFDGTASEDTVAATGLALLPFLAAGQTHKASKDNAYKDTIRRGLAYLVQQQKADGSFYGGTSGTRMYAQGIATVALCESLGMSGDVAGLRKPAQKAVNYIVSAQGPKGGWWYEPRLNGDVSVTGWQIQALQSAKMCRDLTVPNPVYKRANEFLGSVASGDNNSRYGYTDKKSFTPARTAVGLLSRYYVDNWGPSNLGMIDGVKYLMAHGVPSKSDKKDVYYCYYATQVIHYYGGKEWNAQWNPSMRNWLVETQVQPGQENAGSWDPEESNEAKAFGRLGQTCFSVLTLEVYYRMTPMFQQKASTSGETEKSK